jgi:hypothetical protein
MTQHTNIFNETNRSVNVDNFTTENNTFDGAPITFTSPKGDHFALGKTVLSGKTPTITVLFLRPRKYLQYLLLLILKKIKY